MADEWIDVLDQKGNLTHKKILKSEAHKLGVFHQSVHLWLYTSTGNLLLQKRAPAKDTYPGLWDVSVAGHISYQEAPMKAALRESREELGIMLQESNLSFIGTFKSMMSPSDNIIDNEFHRIYISEFLGKISELQLQKEEVSQVKLIPIKTLYAHVMSERISKEYVPHGPTYYNFILKEITNKLK
ncbi:NUDIX domain-containing protein [Aquimarina hainanensis]|uniref:NUDIX domain-containing protein n=1 Tax=Aquimarina hainanensis TaxID=1578017 RepID=A0ABW5NDP9_9FLAO